MRTTYIPLDHPVRLPTQFEQSVATYYVPTLPAFAVEHAELWCHPDVDGAAQTHFFVGDGLRLEGTQVVWDGYRPPIFFPNKVPTLVLHYHGIRDYALLFPSVGPPALKERLARYYEEAERTFEIGSWLAFSLMCGAVFEGLLVAYTGDRKSNFVDLIAHAVREKWLSEAECAVFDRIRILRNLTHAGRFDEPYVSRADAMDARTTMDHIVRRLSYLDSGKRKPVSEGSCCC